MKFGNLTVLYRAPDHKTSGGQNVTVWVCRCQCGNEITVTSQNLRTGHTKSCGCLFPMHNLKHGACINPSDSRLYGIWNGMKARCLSKNNPSYSRYGKRGIKICEEWSKFEAFRDWSLLNGYNDTLTIDRIDNDGDYEPKNCRWTVVKVQSNNTRRNVKIDFQGETYTISEWSDITGIPYKALWYRLNSGWEVEKAFSTPLRR